MKYFLELTPVRGNFNIQGFGVYLIPESIESLLEVFDPALPHHEPRYARLMFSSCFVPKSKFTFKYTVIRTKSGVKIRVKGTARDIMRQCKIIKEGKS